MKGQKNFRSSVPAIAVVACLFVGIVIGLYSENITAGTLIGLGVGLIVMAILRFVFISKKANLKIEPTKKIL
jgi:Na+/proline symporter